MTPARPHRVALVSHDVQTVQGGRAGGVAAFVTHFARLLRGQGEDVTIILTRQEIFPVTVDPAWRARYAGWGIRLIEIHNDPPSAARWSDAWPLRLSEKLLPHLEGFDIAYFQDWANVAFQAARIRRFGPSKLPRIVTVLHGPSLWNLALNQRYPHVPEDLHVAFMESYSARHSDAVVAPSRYMRDWAVQQGWVFNAVPQVLGLPYLADEDQVPADAPVCGALRRLLFFGRLETRKGFALFTAALRLLPELWPRIDEVILLGQEDEPGSAEATRRALAATGMRVTHIGNLDTPGARAYLADAATDTLAVIPSPAENFPYAVIETSLIPGLRMICSSGGGTPEVLGPAGNGQLFEPWPQALANRIRQSFAEPAAARDHATPAATYDYASANLRWLHFHGAQVAAPPRQPMPAGAPLSVDICIPYFNKKDYLPQLLEALENQTAQTFGVIAVDDGSTEPGAAERFDALAKRCEPRGWIFFRQPNGFVDAARNSAARRSRADYLLFIDADDIPAPHTVERLLSAARYSQDDCLLSGGYLFEGAEPSVTKARYLPLGPNLVSGLVDPIVFGPPMILIRREVFEALGGYREIRGAAHEDWELQVRLLLNGYRTDVVPECLLYFRRLEGGLAHTSADFPAKQRLTGAYEQHLAKVGLQGLAGLAHLLNRRPPPPPPEDRNEQLKNRVRRLMLARAGGREAGA